MVKVDASRFYGEYHGHLVEHLEVLLPALRESTNNESTTESSSHSNSENAPLIWTAGDSSLDNKYWFHDRRTAVGAYRDILDPPSMNADVTYWLNRLAIDRATATRNNSSNTNTASNTASHTHMATINTAIEATTIQQRTWKLLAQDAFLRDNIHPGDTLIVSIGGNDVANAPTPCTIASMLCLVKAPQYCLEGPHIPCTCWTPPCNEHCWGFGPVSMMACCTSMPPCLGYINHLFGTRTQHYIEALTAKTKPKRILVCMIYYLDETPTPSWAGTALKCLGYDDDPERLQYLIRKFYVEATSKIQIQDSGNNTTVIPVPLFEVLDGKTSGDYVSRVEPSSQGGKKMAEYLLDIIDRDELRQQQNQHNSYQQSTHPTLTGSGPVESSYMLDRS